MTLLREEDTSVNKFNIKTKELFEIVPEYLKPYFDEAEYPWEILPKIKEICGKILEKGLEGYTILEEGILVGRNVKIAKTATINPPAIIGHDTEIRPGAYIRGNVIVGEQCVVGNSSEFKNCILLDRVQNPHYNYVGDSILGFYSHMGAGSITSNVKSDKTLVVVKCDGEEIETGLKKFGAMLGDHVEVGCNSVLNPGTVIGRNTNIYPLSPVRGVIPANSIYKDKEHIVNKK